MVVILVSNDVPSESGGPRDNRPRFPDDVDGWIAFAKTEADVVMLDAENQTVFVHYFESDEFDRGWTWVANGVNEAGRRSNSYATDNLVRRWFEEALGTGHGQAYPMDLDEAPIGGHYVE